MRIWICTRNNRIYKRINKMIKNGSSLPSLFSLLNTTQQAHWTHHYLHSTFWFTRTSTRYYTMDTNLSIRTFIKWLLQFFKNIPITIYPIASDWVDLRYNFYLQTDFSEMYQFWVVFFPSNILLSANFGDKKSTYIVWLAFEINGVFY